MRIQAGMTYSLALERRYDATFPTVPVPTSYWYGTYEQLWPLMEAAIAAGTPLTPEALMQAQGMVMPPRDVEV